MCYMPRSCAIVIHGGTSRERLDSSTSSVEGIIAALKECARRRDLAAGRRIHAQASRGGTDSNTFVANSLLHMYARCGALPAARDLFYRMDRRSTASWNTMLLAFAEHGRVDLALELFSSMQLQGLDANARTIVACVKACTPSSGKSPWSSRELELAGMGIHSRAVELGLELDAFVGNALVEMYARSGRMDRALQVFGRIEDCCNASSWNAMILGYVESGDGELALGVFQTMIDRSSCAPDARTFVAVLKACLSLEEDPRSLGGELVKAEVLEKVMAIHREASRLDPCVFLANSLIDSYRKCGSVEDSKRVFDEIPTPTLVSWNALILSYAENGRGRRALELFLSMNCGPSSRTLVAAVKSCSAIAAGSLDSSKGEVLELGMAVHARASALSLDSDLFVATSLIDMYSKLGSMEDAQRVFDKMSSRSLISWNALILGYAENGGAEKSLDLFEIMQQIDGLDPDSHTFVAVLKACSKLAAKEEARGIDVHGTRLVKAKSLERSMAIHALAGEIALRQHVKNTLVDCYAKSGSLEDAEAVFWKTSDRSPVACTALVLGYVDHGDTKKALELFDVIMRVDRQVVGSLVLAAALKASARVADLATTKSIQAEIFRRDHSEAETNTVINALIHAFGECGSAAGAQRIFDSFQPPVIDLVSWNSLMAAHARAGNSNLVLSLFRKLQEERRLPPDSATFLAVLAACNHAGRVADSARYLREMSGSAAMEHYDCVADGLARANEIEAAVAAVENMPVSGSAVSWRSLLAACVKWKNLAMGEVAFQALLETSDGHDPAAYALMANLYAS